MKARRTYIARTLTLLTVSLAIAGSLARADPAPSSPTIIFESGLGDGAGPWHPVIAKLDGRFRTFAYDRPGYGRTPTTDTPRDPCTVAKELHTRLAASGQRAPYIVVGHSLGGQYAYAFARLYPEEMAGLLLVDATPPGHWRATEDKAPAAARIVKLMRGVSFSPTMRREFDAQDQCLDGLARAPLSFPIEMLVKTRPDPIGGATLVEIDRALAQGWAASMGATAIRPVAGSGHYIQRDRPAEVVAAIERIASATTAPPR